MIECLTIVIHQGEDETAEEKEEGIEGILSDVLDDEAVIKATLSQVKSDQTNKKHIFLPRSWTSGQRPKLKRPMMKW